MSDPAPDEVLRARLCDLAEQVRRADRMVRDGEPEGVHDLRVAMRRARSLLRTFRPLLDAEIVPDTERMRDELKWAGGELGSVRDLEVVHGRLAAAAAPPASPESVSTRLEGHREQAGNAARRQVANLLASERYATMLEDLDGLAARVAFDRVTLDHARERLRKDWRRTRRRAKAADRARPGEERELALHEVRKAAKRARYAAEALVPVFGDRAQRMAGVAEQVQETLGVHRDTLLTRRLLHRLGVEADGDAEEEQVFAFGRLHAVEQAHGEDSLADYEKARAELDRKKLRRWLR